MTDCVAGEAHWKTSAAAGFDHDLDPLLPDETSGETDVASGIGIGHGVGGQWNDAGIDQYALAIDASVLHEVLPGRTAWGKESVDMTKVQTKMTSGSVAKCIGKGFGQIVTTVPEYAPVLASADAAMARGTPDMVRRYRARKAVVVTTHNDRNTSVGTAGKYPGRNQRVELADVNDVRSLASKCLREFTHGTAGVETASESGQLALETRREVAAAANKFVDLHTAFPQRAYGSEGRIVCAAYASM